ncbi:MAG: rRNA maturation RNase YbeY [Phycisphaerales bacterium JB041]
MEDDASQCTEPPSPGERRAILHIEIADDDRLLGEAGREWLVSTAAAALAPVAELGGEVRGRIVGDAEMAEAHEKWLDIPGTTDVLTFDMREHESEPLDVDLLLCFDEASRQAAERGLRPEHELLLYTVHGVLHCLGHDDHTEADAARMHAEEDRLLAAAGVGPVYAAAERADAPARSKEPTK